MDFEELKRKLGNVKYRSDRDWEMFFPSNVRGSTVQKLIEVCREAMIVDWHIVFPEDVTAEVRVWWDRGNMH